MFEIGFWEMVLVGAVGLLVLGPERLPRVARETALWVRKAKSAIGSVKADIDRELELEEIRQSLNVKAGRRISLLEETPSSRTKRTGSEPETDASTIGNGGRNAEPEA
jgi:sec-independent protein translocase protein TatB